MAGAARFSWLAVGFSAFLALALPSPSTLAWATARPASPRPTVSHPCGTAKGAPHARQVLVIWEENHSYSSVVGDRAAPEMNRLTKVCGLATNYDSLTHPSLPNYLEMTSGRDYATAPWDTDCGAGPGCSTSAPSIFSELSASGHQWRSYVEAMVGNCSAGSYGDYDPVHNPAIYYSNIRAQCRAWDAPMGTPSAGPMHQDLARGPTTALTTVTPDVEDNMHNGTVGQADQWLAGWLPEIIASPAYQSGRLAVLIVWDEGFGGGNLPSHVPVIVMSASTPAGARSARSFNDFSILRTISDITGVKPLAEASAASSLVAPFHL